jgi:hypothetical protein
MNQIINLLLIHFIQTIDIVENLLLFQTYAYIIYILTNIIYIFIIYYIYIKIYYIFYLYLYIL